MKLIHILNGPNLNMLGLREPEIYGSQTLEGIAELCRQKAAVLNLEVDFKQSNSEGQLVSWIQDARTTASGIVLNAAAYTHTSIAIQDAIKACGLPVIEVHLSNVYKRESFRHKSFVSPVAAGVICGFGSHSYVLAIDALAHILGATEKG